MPTRQAAGGGARVDSLVITEPITSSYHGRGLVAMIIPGGDAPFESIPEPTLATQVRTGFTHLEAGIRSDHITIIWISVRYHESGFKR